MKSLIHSRCALSLSAAAVLVAGCGGPQQVVSGVGALPQMAAGNAAHAGASASGKDASAAKREKLVYISSSTNDGCYLFGCPSYAAVSAYKYGDGAYLGEWSSTTASTALGECSDRTGNVFAGIESFTSAQSTVLEFAHGGTDPIKALNVPSGYASECAVDAASGNLAVVAGSDSVAIYAGASGSPTTYTDPNMSFTYLGYDGSGNLFVDGFTSAGFGLVELPKGSSSFEAIKINQSIGYPGSVQWDGKHVTVDDGKGSPRAANVIWRFAIRGTRGKYVGSTPLEDGGFASLKPFTWIFGSRVIAINLTGCAITCGYDAPIYDYPAGGSATKLLGGSDSFANVTGITVSLPH